jgi:hypothetical protein
MQAVVMYKIMNMLIPLNSIYMMANQQMMYASIAGEQARTASLVGMAGAQVLANGMMFAGILMMNKQGEAAQRNGRLLVGLAGALYAVNIALALIKDPTSKLGIAGLITATLAGGAGAVLFADMMQDMMEPPEDFKYEPVDFSGLDTGYYANMDPSIVGTMDMGGRFSRTYDTGGYSSEHGLAVLQAGETVRSKTANIAGGSGTTIHIHGDVYDEEKFIDKVTEVMGPVSRQLQLHSRSPFAHRTGAFH